MNQLDAIVATARDLAAALSSEERHRRLLDRERLFGVLYDPLGPARAVVLDGLPSVPQTDGEA